MMMAQEEEDMREYNEELDRKEYGKMSNLEKRAPEDSEEDYDDYNIKRKVKQEELSDQEEVSRKREVISKEKIKKLNQKNEVSIMDMLQNSAAKSKKPE